MSLIRKNSAKEKERKGQNEEKGRVETFLDEKIARIDSVVGNESKSKKGDSAVLRSA